MRPALGAVLVLTIVGTAALVFVFVRSAQTPPPTSTTTGTPSATAKFHLLRTIPLAVAGRIDHMDVDVSSGRLFVAERGNDTVSVLDLNSGRVIRRLSGFQEPQGVLFISGLNRLFVTNGGDGTIEVFEGRDFGLIKVVKLSADADNIRYDPRTRLVYVGFGQGSSSGIALLNATNDAIIATIPLNSHPESFQLEENGSRIFVNIPTEGVVVIDKQKLVPITTWSLEGSFLNFPMAIDETHFRLFVGTWNPPQLTVFNTNDGKIITRVNVSNDVDDIFYNPSAGLIYLSCGEGFVDIVNQTSADQYAMLAEIPTGAGARTSLLVPELHLLVVAIPEMISTGAEVRVYQIG